MKKNQRKAKNKCARTFRPPVFAPACVRRFMRLSAFLFKRLPARPHFLAFPLDSDFVRPFRAFACSRSRSRSRLSDRRFKRLSVFSFKRSTARCPSDRAAFISAARSGACARAGGSHGERLARRAAETKKRKKQRGFLLCKTGRIWYTKRRAIRNRKKKGKVCN